MKERVHSSGSVCVDCMVLLCNGDVPYDMTEEQVAEWQAEIDVNTSMFSSVTPGILAEEHEDGCQRRDGDAEVECDCESDPYGTYPCDMCGSTLHGARHAVTFWEAVPEPAPLGQWPAEVMAALAAVA